MAQIATRLDPSGLTLLVIAEEDEHQIALFGNVGDAFFSTFAQSPEYLERKPNPIDRYSQRVLEALSPVLPDTATLVMPSDQPYAPFQRWAQQGAYHPSPLGLLIHERYGLWTAFRGAWRVPANTFVSTAETPSDALSSFSPSPCASCQDKPCLTKCPVQAFHISGFAANRCQTHLDQSDAACWSHQCQARLACPIATRYRYKPEAGRFFLGAFYRGMKA